MLSLYERGEVKDIKPQTLWLLAQVYKVGYRELAQLWAQERLGIRFGACGRMLREVTPHSLTLPVEDQGGEIKVVTVDELAARQKTLPGGSVVGVAAIDFLDDDIFFDPVVIPNIKKGVHYVYLLPKHVRPDFDIFVRRVRNKLLEDASVSTDILERLDGEDDDAFIRFIPRPDRDYPVNYTVVIPSDSDRIEAFVGLLYRKRIAYCQVADEYLTQLLVNSFRWTITLLTKYPETACAIEKLEEKVKQAERKANQQLAKKKPSETTKKQKRDRVPTQALRPYLRVNGTQGRP